jgi:hypothetical protein
MPKAVGVLETEDHAPAAIVVAQHGAGTAIGGRVGDAAGAQQAVAGLPRYRDIEGFAAAGAVRR